MTHESKLEPVFGLSSCTVVISQKTLAEMTHELAHGHFGWMREGPVHSPARYRDAIERRAEADEFEESLEHIYSIRPTEGADGFSTRELTDRAASLLERVEGVDALRYRVAVTMTFRTFQREFLHLCRGELGQWKCTSESEWRDETDRLERCISESRKAYKIALAAFWAIDYMIVEGPEKFPEVVCAAIVNQFCEQASLTSELGSEYVLRLRDHLAGTEDAGVHPQHETLVDALNVALR